MQPQRLPPPKQSRRTFACARPRPRSGVTLRESAVAGLGWAGQDWPVRYSGYLALSVCLGCHSLGAHLGGRRAKAAAEGLVEIRQVAKARRKSERRNGAIDKARIGEQPTDPLEPLFQH